MKQIILFSDINSRLPPTAEPLTKSTVTEILPYLIDTGKDPFGCTTQLSAILEDKSEAHYVLFIAFINTIIANRYVVSDIELHEDRLVYKVVNE